MRNWIRNSILLLLLGVFVNNSLIGQNSKKIEALNSYAQFLNESVHGLFTAHALMVISNKEVNRYIDLDSYIINNISNDEVQSNLFDKSDKENYTTFHTYSPIELQTISAQNSQYLKSSLANSMNKQVDAIVVILNKINKLRIVIDDFIGSHDLNQKESIYGIFEHLEEGVSLFRKYSEAHTRLSKDIEANRYDDKSSIFIHANAVHKSTQTILRNLRLENDSSVASNIRALKNDFSQLNIDAKTYGIINSSSYKNNVQLKIEKIIELMEGFESPGYVPVEHELYGKHYYYHNEIAKRYFNWAGPGFVRHLNTVLEDLNISVVKFVEEPLIFKVVYPMKLDDINTLEKKREALDERITNINNDKLKFSTPKERIEEGKEIVITQEVITAKPEEPLDNYVTLEIFDHNMFDRDSISVSFNGEFILEDYLLTPQKKVIKLDLDQSDVNSLTFEAKNWGIRAPNTFAIAYRYNGQRRRVYEEYNLNKNESVKIDLVRP